MTDVGGRTFMDAHKMEMHGFGHYLFAAQLCSLAARSTGRVTAFGRPDIST